MKKQIIRSLAMLPIVLGIALSSFAQTKKTFSAGEELAAKNHSDGKWYVVNYVKKEKSLHEVTCNHHTFSTEDANIMTKAEAEKQHIVFENAAPSGRPVKESSYGKRR